MNKRVEGNKIKLARAARGMTQQELSNASGLSRPTISKIEKEGTDNSEYIEIIADTLKINPSELEGDNKGEKFSPAKLMALLEKAVDADLSKHDRQLTLEMLDWFKSEVLEEGEEVGSGHNDH